MPTATALEIVRDTGPVTWGTARKIAERVRDGGRAYLELGPILETLRAQFFAQTVGLRRGTAPSPHDAATGEKGWQASVREEIGISDDTARRVILDSVRYRQILQIAAGEVDIVDDHKVTADARKKAKAVIDEIAADPSVRPARKWAGLWSSVETKGTQRAATDHYKNCAAAAAKYATSLEHYYDFTTEQRDYLDATFGELLAAGLIPESWLVMMAKRAKGGRQ